MPCPDLQKKRAHSGFIASATKRPEGNMSTQDWNEIDMAISAGQSSMDIWTRFGRRLGLSLEAVVMRRQCLKSAPRKAPRRGRVLPLFERGSSEGLALVANG